MHATLQMSAAVSYP